MNSRKLLRIRKHKRSRTIGQNPG